ncbi:MAG: hypothetical protein AB7L70_10280 [Pyrinomonadaceae bacterium]
MDVEADFRQIEPQKIDLHRVVSEFVLDLGVLDAGVDLLEILREGTATERTEDRENRN